MSEYTLPKFRINERYDLALNIAGLIGFLGAIGYAALKGDIVPLFGMCSVLTFILLFVTSDS